MQKRSPKPAFSLPLCLFSALLAGCAAPGIPESADFVSEGRFSVLVRGPQGDERESGNYLFISESDKTSLKVSGPLGAQIAYLEDNGVRTRLTVAGKDPTESQNSSELMMSAIGIPVGVADLKSLLNGEACAKKTDRIGSLSVSLKCTDQGKLTHAVIEGVLAQTASSVKLVLAPLPDKP